MAGDEQDGLEAGLLRDFITEASEHLEGMDSDLLLLEEHARDPDFINRVFRAIHTIKGVAGMLGLSGISGLSHRMENMLDRFRKAELSPDPARIDLLLRGCDCLKRHLRAVDPDAPDAAAAIGLDGQSGELCDELDLSLAAGPAAGEGLPPAPGASTVPAEPAPGALEEFLVDAQEQMESLDALLLACEKGQATREDLDAIFRAVHSLKGSAGYLGLDVLGATAHAFENVLGLARQLEGFAVDAGTLDLFLEATGALKALLARVRAREPLEAPGPLLARLEEFAGSMGLEADQPEAAPAPASGLDSAAALFLEAAGQYREALSACLEKALAAGGALEDAGRDMAFRSIHSLKASSQYMGYEAMAAWAADAEACLGSAGPGSGIDLPAFAGLIMRLDDLLSGLRAPAPPPAAAARKPAPAPAGAPASPEAPASKTMRIDAGLLDRFMNLVGELTVARNALSHLRRRVEEESALPAGLSKDLSASVQAVQRISEAMRLAVMDMRMVPIRQVFQKFPRMVRDISRRTGKSVDLVLRGEETEIDKAIAESIVDPLVHIVRNAADHGVEGPEERVAAGKEPGGTITLSASHEGNSIVIEVADDGKGMDPARILAKAVEKGLVSAAEAAAWDDARILDLVFEPGFSTAEKVTDISGRGVGMDVVRTNIRAVGGRVKIASMPGKGTTVRLELPLTMAVIEAMVVEAGGETFAVPTASVVEMIKVDRGRVRSLLGRSAFNLRGRVVGLAGLAETLGFAGRPAGRKEESVLILNGGGDLAGFAVDALLRREEVVVKPLPPYLAALPGLAGASILGDGRAILILDPERLVALARLGAGSEDAAGADGALSETLEAAA